LTLSAIHYKRNQVRVFEFLVTLPDIDENFPNVDEGFSNSHYKNRFFESPPKAGFQKTDFGVSIAAGDGNTKIGFIMRIAVKGYIPLIIFNIWACHE
jgi:hypothetical protein